MTYSKKIIAGVDEAGRGPLAGPVYAAAVILNPKWVIEDIKDSKKLTEKKRELIYPLIKQHALCVSVGIASVEEIDEINILQATMLAMQRAVAGLTIKPDHVLIDGNRCPELPYPATAIIGGDDSEPAISAASIIAKVERDWVMMDLDQQYQGYGFASHKGYGTQQHLAALAQHGPTPVHRKSFAPVAQYLELT